MSGLRAEQCTAKAKSSGIRCGRLVLGGGVCIMHGGNAPQVRAKREARILVAEAGQMEPLSAVDAADALTSALNDSHSILQRLKANIASGRLETRDLTAMGEWVDRLAKVSKLVLDAGIQERQVRISEDQGRLIFGAIQQILDRLVLDDRQRALVPIVVPAVLRAIES